MPRLPVIVIPCYNEQHRLDIDEMLRLGGGGRVHLLFVNDGSTDMTTNVLAALAASEAAIDVLELAVNNGKGEAVRRGLLRAIAAGAPVVGYYDADLATPPTELLRLVDTLEGHPDIEAVLGSRVARLGCIIERSPARHYPGRIFATAASIALRLQVYDTQCGAKVFRVTPSLIAAVQQPFHSTWAFDVELLHRLVTGQGGVAPVPPRALLEVPLDTWKEMGDSRLTASAMLCAFADVMTLMLSTRCPGCSRPPWPWLSWSALVRCSHQLLGSGRAK